MARSRTGGSNGLLSGKLGDVIYSITRNGDGSFRQSISNNPSYRDNPNTDEQARARCTMATIERAMFTFRDFVSTGWEGIDAGTNSVSAFSRYNYNAIKDYVEYFWDMPEEFELQFNLPKKGQQQPRAGCYRLSQGSLKLRKSWHVDYALAGNPHYGVRSLAVDGQLTVKEWLEYNGLEIGDQLVFVFFEEGRTPSLARACYYIFATNANVNPNTIVRNNNFKSLFVLQSNVGGSVTFNEATNVVSYSFDDPQGLGFIGVSVDGVRLRRVIDGRIYYNNCDLFVSMHEPFETWHWQNLSQVKSSWINQ